MTDRIEWTIDAPSLEAFKRGLAAGDSQPEWFRLRREAEELALRPAFREMPAKSFEECRGGLE